MADYPISKEAVLRKLLDLKKSLGCRYISIGLDMALASFDGFPQIDAVPVVRCKDCKYAIVNHNHIDKPLICCLTKMVGTTDEDWFCANGERRMDGGVSDGSDA